MQKVADISQSDDVAIQQSCSDPRLANSLKQESACQLRLMELMLDEVSPFSDYQSKLVLVNQPKIKENSIIKMLDQQNYSGKN